MKDLAEKGFKEAAFSEVTEYPIFVELSSSFPNGVGLGLGVKLPHNLTGRPIEEFSVVNITNNYIIPGRKISGGELYFARDVISDPGNVSIKLIYSDAFNIPAINVANPVGHEDKYNATLGVKNKIIGFSEERFNYLSSLSYNDFKTALKYPISKDISVFVYDGPTLGNLLYNYSKLEPSSKDNVYVVKWTDYVVDEYGDYDSIVILIKTW